MSYLHQPFQKDIKKLEAELREFERQAQIERLKDQISESKYRYGTEKYWIDRLGTQQGN